MTAEHRYETAERILVALRDYEAECNERRRERSQEIYGHPGASIAACSPTDDGRIRAIMEALAG